MDAGDKTYESASVPIDRFVAAVTEDLPEEERERVEKGAARFKVMAKAPARVEAVVADALEYLGERTFPQGFKAQFVAVDREACALAAEELLCLGMAPEEFAVIYTPNAKKDDESLRRWYADAQWRRLHGRRRAGRRSSSTRTPSSTSARCGRARSWSSRSRTRPPRSSS